MFLYILPLEGGNWYVGTTENINKRYESHASGTGAAWTKLHKPVSIDKMKFWEIPYIIFRFFRSSKWKTFCVRPYRTNLASIRLEGVICV